MSTDDELDKWAVWVIHRRDGGDVAQRKKGAEHLLPIRMVYSTEPISKAGDIVLRRGW